MSTKTPSRFVHRHRRPASRRAHLRLALAEVESRLDRIYGRANRDDLRDQISGICAVTDPTSEVWDEVMQITYLENAREGLSHAIKALDRRHGRSD